MENTLNENQKTILEAELKGHSQKEFATFCKEVLFHKQRNTAMTWTGVVVLISMLANDVQNLQKACFIFALGLIVMEILSPSQDKMIENSKSYLYDEGKTFIENKKIKNKLKLKDRKALMTILHKTTKQDKNNIEEFIKNYNYEITKLIETEN